MALNYCLCNLRTIILMCFLQLYKHSKRELSKRELTLTISKKYLPTREQTFKNIEIPANKGANSFKMIGIPANKGANYFNYRNTCQQGSNPF